MSNEEIGDSHGRYQMKREDRVSFMAILNKQRGDKELHGDVE